MYSLSYAGIKVNLAFEPRPEEQKRKGVSVSARRFLSGLAVNYISSNKFR